MNFFKLLQKNKSSYNKTNNISFYDMAKLPIGEEFDFYEGIIGSKIKETENAISFRMEMKEGSSFKAHYHTDCIETIVVYRGELQDIKNNKKAVPGIHLIYNCGIMHELLAIFETIFYVEFKKVCL